MDAPELSPHMQRGRTGEEYACSFLREKGYRIISRNWRHRHLEVDIVAQCSQTLIFVEVKTRQSGSPVEPWRAVDHNKQNHLIRAANAFLRREQLQLEVRFDIISLLLNGSQVQIEHIPNAFQPRFR